MPFPLFPFLLMTYEFVLYMSNDMYMPFFPLIATDFNVQDDAVSSTLSAWLLGGATAQTLLGPLSDRYGRKIVLMSGGILFIASCALCILSTSIETMLVARFLQGIGVCSMMIAGYACIHETYQDQQAMKILAMMSSISILAPMIGPVIGGYLALSYNWRIVFWILLLGAALSIVLLFFFMPSTKPSTAQPLSIKSMLFRYRDLCRNTHFILSTLCFSLGYACIMLWISASPFILMQGYGLDTYTFGLVQIPIFGAFVLGSKVTSYCVDKIPLKKLMSIAFGFSLIGLVFLVPSCALDNLTFILISLSLSMVAFGMLTAPLNRLAFNASDSDKGVTASVFYTFMMGSGALITKGFGYFDYTALNFAIAFCGLALAQIMVSIKSTKE